MARVGIVTDSTAYLDVEYVKRHDIKVFPSRSSWTGCPTGKVLT